MLVRASRGSGGSGGSTDILNWTYVDRIDSPSFAASQWSYTFDFSTYKYMVAVSEFGVMNYYFFDSSNNIQKVTNVIATYPVTVTQSGDTVTFRQSINATSNVYIYRYT